MPQGYRGDLSAPEALNLLRVEGNAVLVDIRPTAEKESSGVPDLPSAVAKKSVELEFDSTPV